MMKAVFQTAIEENNAAAFLAAAELHGVRPSAVLPYARIDGVEANSFQVFVCATAQFDCTPAGVHDGIRDGGSSRIVKQAETLAFNKADLAKATLSDVKYASLFYRTGWDSWVFQRENGAFSDPVTWAELEPLAKTVAYQTGHGPEYVNWLQTLEVEKIPS